MVLLKGPTGCGKTRFVEAMAHELGRRASAQARACVWDSLQAVERAVTRLYPNATIAIDGDRAAALRHLATYRRLTGGAA